MSGARRAPGRRPVLMIGPYPPPVHGQALATAALLRALEARGLECRPVDVSEGAGLHGAGGDGARSLDAAWRRMRGHSRALSAALAGPAGPAYVSANSNRGMWLTAAIAAAARLRGRRLLIHHHAYARIRRASPAMTALALAAGPAAAHLALSPGMAAEMGRTTPLARRRETLGNAGLVDSGLAKMERPPRERTLVLGHLANLSLEKGVGRVAAAAAAARAAGRDVRLLVAGPAANAPARAALAEAQAALGDRIEHLGPVDEARKRAFLARIDAMLFPSLYPNEASPLVLLEAMAAGAPCLAFDVGCVAEQLGGAGAGDDPFRGPGGAPRGGRAVARDADFSVATAAFLDDLAPRREEASAAARARFALLLEEHRREIDALAALLAEQAVPDAAAGRKAKPSLAAPRFSAKAAAPVAEGAGGPVEGLLAGLRALPSARAAPPGWSAAAARAAAETAAGGGARGGARGRAGGPAPRFADYLAFLGAARAVGLGAGATLGLAEALRIGERPDLAALFAPMEAAERAGLAASLREIGAVAAALQGAGIEPTLLKGAAHLVADGGAPDRWRDMIDIDLLVAPEEAAAAREALTAIGYAPFPGPYDPEIDHHLPALAPPPGGGRSVEIHTRLGWRDFPELLPLERLRESAERVEIPSPAGKAEGGGARARIPGRRDRLAHLVLHAQTLDHGRHRGTASLKSAFDWVRLAGAAGAGGAEEILSLDAEMRAAGFGREFRMLASFAEAIWGDAAGLPPELPREPAWARRAVARLSLGPRAARLLHARDMARIFLSGLLDPRRRKINARILRDPARRRIRLRSLLGAD